MRKAKSRALWASVCAAAVTIWSSQAFAAHESITPTDYDTLDKGSQVGTSVTSDFISRRGVDLGDLVGSVYLNSATGVYTYAFVLTPGINNISEFNTGYDVAGFNGVAGYSFSQAGAASGRRPLRAFGIEHEDDGTIDWGARGRQNGSKWFDSGESVTFFFQSTIGPGRLQEYNLINHRAGEADNVAPGDAPPPAIPVPAALPAGLALLATLAAARRRRA